MESLVVLVFLCVVVPYLIISNRKAKRKRGEEAQALKIQQLEKKQQAVNATLSYTTAAQPVAPPAQQPKKPDVQYLSKPDLSARWTEEHHADVLSMRDFCVLDVETTGLEPWICRVVQIGIVKVVDNCTVDFLNTYINPEMHIPTRATEIHGITDSDVKGAPTYKQIADRVCSLLNNTTVVGHNVTFDLNFVQHILLECSNPDEDVKIDYIDTWEYAHKVLPHMSDYKLQTLLKYYGIDPGAAHTAYDDACATLKLFNALRYEYAHKDEIEAQRREAEKQARKQKREAEKENRRLAFSVSPLFDVRICFTGDFSIARESMEALASSVGAVVQQKEVNGRTNFLVKGDIADLPEWALDRKLHKAESLISAGKAIQIIDEAEYMRLISEAKSVLSQQEKQ